jgi:hypothetical protein
VSDLMVQWQRAVASPLLPHPSSQDNVNSSGGRRGYQIVCGQSSLFYY